ncbi:LysM peptidoglycan-binding domain-containing protein [Pyxidicoccus fallax]|uniref:LysM peptidoglycan-binding domain-containing protein n=1 Tax=Pyxidicoccus fallax TaxID=394095 RepID=A0A848LU27_9BACT|nr:LysM peptidoglycan-binding domain-containing protein [Pyxidicoccus fallax]NMO21179.1 LysM peptidoglycan-binding domain-containing protein [Pyxidicoccus fallax]NPC78676.1 LysM peptidoglycan-binding domain-containing protein [Pyxidicoccus fallax]
MTSVSNNRSHHTVSRNENLSGIAKANGTTVAELVKLNKIKNPDLIHPGQVLRLPGKSDDFQAKPGTGSKPQKPQKPVDSFKPETKPTQPTTDTSKPTQGSPASSKDLGSLSRKYEAQGPGTVSTGKGDAGGVSYGAYQFASKTGSAKEFVDGLKNTYPEYHKALAGKTPGSAEFTAAWKGLAKKDPEGFFQAQHDAIKKSHYDPQVANIKKATGLDVTTRSKALQDVAWSTSVQHRNNSDDIFKAAMKGKDPSKMSDEDIIKAVYAERGRRNGSGELVHFTRNSRDVQEGVANRFKNEVKDALAMLKKEQAGGGSKPEAKPETKPATENKPQGNKPVEDTGATAKPDKAASKNVKVPFYSQYEGGHGFTPGDTACFKAAVAMAKAAGATVTGPDNRIQVATGENSKGQLSINSKKAAEGRNYIDQQLNAGKPVVVGVSHKDSDYNADKLTDHFVVITGRGVDEKGRTYYTFHDPGTSQKAKGADTNPNNRFYVDDSGKMYRPGKLANGYLTERNLEVAMVRRNA